MARHKIIDTWKLKIPMNPGHQVVKVPVRIDTTRADNIQFIVDYTHNGVHLLK
jgi:hypothetical protein